VILGRLVEGLGTGDPVQSLILWRKDLGRGELHRSLYTPRLLRAKLHSITSTRDHAWLQTILRQVCAVVIDHRQQGWGEPRARRQLTRYSADISQVGGTLRKVA